MIMQKVGKLFTGSSLTARSARGASALAFGTAVERALRFGSYAVFTHLMPASDIGLMTFILIANSLFEAIAEVGIKSVVIQSSFGDRKEFLNLAWFFQSGRGILLFLLGYVMAPYIADFYKHPELNFLLRVSFLSILFRALISPGSHVLEKKFQFYRSVLLIQGSAFCGTAISVILACYLRNIWALVLGYVLGNLILVVFSFVLCPFKPIWRFHKEYFQEILSYAKGMFAVPVLTTIAFGADVFVGAKLFSMTMMGWYSMGRQLAMTPRDLFGRILAPVLLPAFSEKQNDSSVLICAILKISKIIAIFGLPFSAIMGLFGRNVLSVIFGPDYGIVWLPFLLLCFCMYLRIQGMPLATIYLALGKPHMHRFFVGIRAVIILSLIYPAGLYYGLSGIAGTLVIAELIGISCQVSWIRRLIGLRMHLYFLSWREGFVLTAASILLVMGCKRFLPSSDLVQLLAGIILGGGIWGLGGLWVYKKGFTIKNSDDN